MSDIDAVESAREEMAMPNSALSIVLDLQRKHVEFEAGSDGTWDRCALDSLILLNRAMFEVTTRDRDELTRAVDATVHRSRVEVLFGGAPTGKTVNPTAFALRGFFRLRSVSRRRTVLHCVATRLLSPEYAELARLIAEFRRAPSAVPPKEAEKRLMYELFSPPSRLYPVNYAKSIS